jgi:hypothetical protein
VLPSPSEDEIKTPMSSLRGRQIVYIIYPASFVNADMNHDA